MIKYQSLTWENHEHSTKKKEKKKEVVGGGLYNNPGLSFCREHSSCFPGHSILFHTYLTKS